MKAYELIDNPQKWTKGIYARDSLGVPVPTWSVDACCFCMTGALLRCYPDTSTRRTVEGKLQKHLGDPNAVIEAWNDAAERTWDEVHELLVSVDV